MTKMRFERAHSDLGIFIVKAHTLSESTKPLFISHIQFNVQVQFLPKVINEHEVLSANWPAIHEFTQGQPDLAPPPNTL